MNSLPNVNPFSRIFECPLLEISYSISKLPSPSHQICYFS